MIAHVPVTPSSINIFIERDIIGLDDQSHLVYFVAGADLDEGLPVSKSLLHRQELTVTLGAS